MILWRASPEIVSVEIEPDPAAPGQRVSVVVVTTDARSVAGTLGREELRFDRAESSPNEQAWRAVHQLPRDAEPAEWTVTVTAGGAVAEEPFTVGAAGVSRITGFVVTPTSVDDGAEILTFTGRLATESAERVVAVQFRPEIDLAWRDVVFAEAGERGRFEARAQAMETGRWRARLRGTAPATSEEVRVFVARGLKRSRFVGYAVTPSTVSQGRAVTHTGRLQWEKSRNAAGKITKWRSPGTQPVSSEYGASRSSYARKAGGTTQSNGRFVISTPVSKSGYWKVTFGGAGGFGGAESGGRKVTAG
ncbi:hypothetical protein [Nonomuraea africana]|uniref:Uncharacterized protein n=1 Tax=Nonomuraea africana TaxID=46171 RepID=A0ABR9KVN9_9ACTN|nr:hypothetical protein [Nonomuraea africana]MBE1566091.1 hypothetical protein [Nonomuraea africana]